MNPIEAVLQYLGGQEFAGAIATGVAGNAAYDTVKPYIEKAKQRISNSPSPEIEIGAALEDLLLEIATKTNRNINQLRTDVQEALQQKGVKLRDVNIAHHYHFNGQNRTIPHRLTNLIPSSEAGIIGREKELTVTYRLLHQEKPVVLVNGIGGMGKTTLASKYVARCRNDYQHIAWLTVQSSITDAFSNNLMLLQSLHIENEVRQLVERKNLEEAFQLVFKTLDDLGEKAKTLVVLDNANELRELVAYKRLFDTAHCHFLITSRTRPEDWQLVSVEALPNADAMALFRRYYPSVAADDKSLTELLAVLDHHTLLIELVAKSATASGIPFPELQGIIREKFIHAPTLNKRKIATGAHGDSLDDNAKRARVEEYIWLIFENITELFPSHQDLLRAFALLPPATVFKEDFLENHARHFGLANDLLDGLDSLCERGWLEKEQLPGQPPAYKMHPLIADVVMRHLKVEVGFAEPYIKAVRELIDFSNLDPGDNLFEKRDHQALADRLSNLFWEENTEELSYMLDRLGYLEENFGFYHRSATLKERAVQICETIFVKGHPTISTRQSNLANIYSKLGRFEQARDLLETALKAKLKLFPPDHPQIATSQSNLGDVYRWLKKYDRARDLIEASLNTALKNFNPEHPVIAIRQSNLALVYRRLGQHEEAKTLLEAALNNGIKTFGPDHPAIALRQSNLAHVYQKLENFDRAIELHEAALRSDLKNFGPFHPNVANHQYNLAYVYVCLEDTESAKKLFQQAYDLRKVILGDEHPRTQAAKRWLEKLT